DVDPATRRALPDQVGGAVHRRHRRTRQQAPPRARRLRPHGLRCRGAHRRRHLHDHRTRRRGHHRPGHRDLVRHRGDRLRVRGPVLRRVRLDGAGGRQRLHVLLRDLRRVHRLDHRLGPHPRVRARRGRGLEELGAVPGRALRGQQRRRLARARPGDVRLGRGPGHRRPHGRPRARHQALEPGLDDHHLDQGARRAARHRGRALLRPGPELHPVHPAARGRAPERGRGGRVAAVAHRGQRGLDLRHLRPARRGVARLLRVHRVRRGVHHGGGDEEPAEGPAPRDPRLARRRHGPLRRHVARAGGHGQLHPARDAARQRGERHAGHRVLARRRGLGLHRDLHRRARRPDHRRHGAHARPEPGVLRDEPRRPAPAQARPDRLPRYPGDDHDHHRRALRRAGRLLPDRRARVDGQHRHPLRVRARRRRHRLPAAPAPGPAAQLHRQGAAARGHPRGGQLSVADDQPDRRDLDPVHRLDGPGRAHLLRLLAPELRARQARSRRGAIGDQPGGSVGPADPAPV
ncbi:MAG: Uncharacterized amino acid permease, GabP family, partial [uncultured Actinomycetospora sp.]